MGHLMRLTLSLTLAVKSDDSRRAIRRLDGARPAKDHPLGGSRPSNCALTYTRLSRVRSKQRGGAEYAAARENGPMYKGIPSLNKRAPLSQRRREF